MWENWKREKPASRVGSYLMAQLESGLKPEIEAVSMYNRFVSDPAER